MLLTGGYFSLKVIVFNKINSLLTEKITFSNLDLGLFPPRVKVLNLKNFDLKDENIVSFKNISLEVSFLSLFSKSKRVNLYVHSPMVVLNDNILKKKDKKKTPTKLPFKINRITIINGELLFKGKKITADLLNFNLNSFTKSGKTMYKLESPHMKCVFPLSGGRVTLEGDMACEFRPQRTSLKVSRFVWNTNDLRISLNGRVFDNGSIAMNASLRGTPEKILYPVLKDLRPLGYSECTAKIRRKKKETLFISGEVHYKNLAIADEVFENVEGSINWDSTEKMVKVDLLLDDGPLRSNLKVFSRPKLTRLQVENISAQRISRIVKIDDAVPLGGIISKGQIFIRKGIINGPLKMVPRPLTGSPYALDRTGILNPVKNYPLFNAGGLVDFRYDGKSKAIRFTARDVNAEFGSIESLEGEIDPTKSPNMTIKANAGVNDMEFLNKYTNYFIGLDLSPWKLKAGKGSITLDLKRIGKKFFVESDIDIRNFTTTKQPIQTLTGHISTKNSLTSGTFEVIDRDVTGNAELFVSNDIFTIAFKNLEGKSQKIMKILDFDLLLSGNMKGNILVTKKNTAIFPLIQGKFSAKQINFYDFIFDNITGDLEFQDQLKLTNLDFSYNDGKGKGDVFIDYEMEMYKIDGQIKGIDINRLNPEFSGRGDVFFDGEGAFFADPIRFNYESGSLNFFTDRSFTVKGSGNIFTNFSDFRIDTGGNIWRQTRPSPFSFQLNQVAGIFSGAFKITLKDINLLVPWGNNDGTIELDSRISENNAGELTTEGHAVFNGRVLSFPNFPHALENFSGDIIFKDLDFTLRSLEGTIGGGKVESSGYLNAADNKLNELSIGFVGRNMNLYFLDRTSFTLNADLNLKLQDNGKILLAGNMDLLSGIWKREVTEDLTFNTDPSLSSSGSNLLDRLEFDLKLSGKDNLRMENSFGKFTGKFNLTLTGNPDFPILMGTIECRDGEINFSGKKFDLVKARLVFNSKFMIDPLVNVESESFIKNYRIKFNIKGNSSNLKPELTSSPPLPYRDILTLITLGELFKRPTSTELSSRVGTGTTGLITAQLTEQITKRTKKLFGNYMLTIDPNISNIAGASFEDTSRLIVGKEISKDFLVVYATNFSTQRQQVIYLQYHLSPSISLIGMRNEEGRYSLDLRYRKRR
ncbi:MAG: hypothetical protein GY757_05275 [bacterium]|nr:hypothetical protein [bacterium]